MRSRELSREYNQLGSKFDRQLRRGEDRVLRALCSTFLEQSIWTWNYMKDCMETSSAINEETITDLNLMYIRKRHPKEVVNVQIPRGMERAIGADWEWWLGADDGWLGLSIQAKRINPKSLRYEELDTKNAGVRQVDRLIASANKRRLIPIYVFYNYWDAVRFHNVFLEYPFSGFISRSRNPDFSQFLKYVLYFSLRKCYDSRIVANFSLFGSSMSHAGSVRNLLDDNRVETIENLAEYGFYCPWSCLVCCPESNQKKSLPFRSLNFFRYAFHLGVEEGTVRKQAPSYVSKVLSRKELTRRDWEEIEADRVTAILEVKGKHTEESNFGELENG